MKTHLKRDGAHVSNHGCSLGVHCTDIELALALSLGSATALQPLSGVSSAPKLMLSIGALRLIIAEKATHAPTSDGLAELTSVYGVGATAPRYSSRHGPRWPARRRA